MFCPKCGAKSPDNTTYCPRCGADLSVETTPLIPPILPLAITPARKSRKKIVIAVTAVILILSLLAGGIVAFWNWNHSSTADHYYMSRCLLTVDGDTAFDVSYTADRKMSSFDWIYNGTPDAFNLTPTYDQDGRVQTLTCTAKWEDFTHIYRFHYDASRIPGTDVEGTIGTDPSDPTFRLYYDQDNNWMGMSAGQDNGAESKLIVDGQQRIQSFKIGNTTADFDYDADGNLTYLQWYTSNSFVPLNSIAGDIVSSIVLYQIWSQFSDFTSFLLWADFFDDTSFTLQLQYREGRLSGGSFITDDYFGATLVQTSSTETSDSLNATVAGETLQFPITIQYNGGHPSEIEVDIIGYEDGVVAPVPLLRGTFDKQGHAISTILFDPDDPSVPVLELQRNWEPCEK